jgi:protoporphyrinogen oxidase
MPNIIILGTGMAGFGAAYHLHNQGIIPVMYDKHKYYGGHTSSFRYDTGFLFDLGPHISFTKDPRIQELFASSVEQQYETLQVNLNNYWHGYWPKHPVQLHLNGLPEGLIIKVIADFVAEHQASERPVKNYEDWLIASFGRTFAESFPIRYARKYHTTTAANMTTDWLGPRVYRPSLEEVLRGTLSPSAPNIHYISQFRYPSKGGFMSYLTKFVPLANICLNHELVAINPRIRQITFSNGYVTDYDALVSSIPLPDLIPMIHGVPPDVLSASKRLACSTCVLVNVGVNRQDLSSAHMTYFYDEDICFTRASFPHMLSPTNAPPETGSIQAEVYFSSKYKPFAGSPDDWIEPVLTDLHRCGLLREGDRILSRRATLLRYANVIFDHDRSVAVRTVHGYLDDIGIFYCGRYGDWGYLWTDESFISGENAADRALHQLRAQKLTRSTSALTASPTSRSTRAPA